jgi:single-strand DNA-binding protein
MGRWYTESVNNNKQHIGGSMNSVTLCGRLGKDPETRAVGNGQVTKFSLATGYKKTDGTQHTDWHQIEAWNKTGEIAQKYLTKGKQVIIQGEIRYSTSEKNGVKTYFTSIIANKIELLGSAEVEPKAEEPATYISPNLENFDVNEIPF